MPEISCVDRIIGAKVRAKRMAIGFRIAKLAAELGISEFQLVQIERGAKRIKAANMLKLCKLFDVSAQYFFDSWEIADRSARTSSRGPCEAN